MFSLTKMISAQTSIRRISPLILNSARGKTTETYSQKQVRLGRPVSPDLEIYKLPPGAVSSIIVGRITGITMWTGKLCTFECRIHISWWNLHIRCPMLVDAYWTDTRILTSLLLLSVFCKGLASMSLVQLAGYDVASIMHTMGNSSVSFIPKFCVALPLTYHLLGAARHIVSSTHKLNLHHLGITIVCIYIPFLVLG